MTIMTFGNTMLTVDWLIIWTTIILVGIAGFRIGYNYGHNDGFDRGVKSSIDHIENQLREGKNKGV